MKNTETLKKCRLYINFLKERDWLEEMAAQGWIFTDINMGIFYKFKKSIPCEKVFEVERFAVSSRPTVQELNARKIAIDIATQSGWEVVTHDEDMNYYFMKDKAGDETDEFYDDENLRKKRAQRYHRHHAYEVPLNLLKGNLLVSFLYIMLLLLMAFQKQAPSSFLLWFFLIYATIEFACILGSMVIGQRLYTDFSLTRAEWSNRRKNGVRKHFYRVQHLRSFLQTQSENGLALTGYDGGKYLFEEDTCRYNYFVDTKACLKKRLKEQGLPYKDDQKNISAHDLKWYEISIANAAQYGLKPVAVVQNHVLIYKRPYSHDMLPWENGNARISRWRTPPLIGLLLFIACFMLGCLVGFLFSPVK